MPNTSIIEALMTGLAERTGLTTSPRPPQRYLWTDAFAVCNYLELFCQTGKIQYQQDALNLIHQVHNIRGSTARTIRGMARSAGWTSRKRTASDPGRLENRKRDERTRAGWKVWNGYEMFSISII
jgi:hypothetical protein